MALRGVVFGWSTFEAARYTGLLRKRQKLGLAAPALLRRFELTALATGCSTFTCGTALVIVQTGVLPRESLLVGLTFSIPLIITAVALWMICFGSGRTEQAAATA